MCTTSYEIVYFKCIIISSISLYPFVLTAGICISHQSSSGISNINPFKSQAHKPLCHLPDMPNPLARNLQNYNMSKSFYLISHWTNIHLLRPKKKMSAFLSFSPCHSDDFGSCFSKLIVCVFCGAPQHHSTMYAAAH